MGPKQIRQITPVLITSPPGVSDDALQNYKVGSLVYSISDQTFYECSDATVGAAVWGAVSFGGGGTPGGADTEVQFNDGGAFGGDAGFTFDKATGLVNIGSLTAGRGVLADASKNLTSDGIGETRVAYNTSTQAVTSTSETNITALVLSVAANKKYLVEVAIATECSGASGILFGHKFPTGSTFKLTHSGRTSAAAATMNLGNVYTANTGLINNPVNTAASATGSYVASCLLVTTNAGNYQLTFASVSGAQTSTIREYGHIKLTEIP